MSGRESQSLEVKKEIVRKKKKIPREVKMRKMRLLAGREESALEEKAESHVCLKGG